MAAYLQQDRCPDIQKPLSMSTAFRYIGLICLSVLLQGGLLLLPNLLHVGWLCWLLD